MAQRSPIIVVLLIAVLLGYLAGGRLGRFGSVHLHWWGLAFVGVALQALPTPSIGEVDPHLAGTATLIASYVLLLLFLGVNRWIPAARLMALGLGLNLAVVALNGGMPVSAWAIRETSGSAVQQLPTVESSPKHHLMTDDDVLAPLGDVIPLPPPAGVVLSIGDVLLYAGVAWFVIQVMRGRSRENPRPLALWVLRYRGKHAPDHWRMPARYRASAHAGAGRSGI
jgi:hypothetical protein